MLKLIQKLQCIEYELLLVTVVDNQVNVTDIAEHCDTMSQKRSMNPLYSCVLYTISGVDS